MNIDELKTIWEDLYRVGTPPHSADDIKKMVSIGTSATVTSINQKLFREMTLTALAAIVSALAIVGFYTLYDPIKHPQVDVSLIIPVQILAFAIFLVLLLVSFFEYKLVNQPRSPDNIRAFIEKTLTHLKSYYRWFNGITLSLLLVTYSLEINYFLAPETFSGSVLVAAIAGLLTGISYLIIDVYYRRTWKGYVDELEGYRDTLRDS